MNKPPYQHRRLVYIIEDDEAVRDSLALLLSANGWRASPFESAQAFLAADPEPDEAMACLLLDINLPGMNGVELQRRLREDGRHIPTVILTAQPDHHLAWEARRHGARAIISKPMDAIALLRTIDGLQPVPAADP